MAKQCLTRASNFSEEEKLFDVAGGIAVKSIFSLWKIKGTLTKKAKAWEKILNKFNSQNRNSCRTSSCFPKSMRKLVADVITQGHPTNRFGKLSVRKGLITIS